MAQGVFRETSLQRLSSPEQLDQLIKVTSLKAWLALIALGLILAGVILWGFLGSIPTKISGQGILLNNGGVFSLTPPAAGQVIDVRFRTGELVKKGDVVARIDQPGLVEEINGLLESLRDLEEKGLPASSEYRAAESRVADLRNKLDYQSQIVSPIDGRLLELNIREGGVVQPGETLVVLEPVGPTVRLEAVLYVPAGQGKEILPGMEVQISLSIVNKEEYGFMLGRVISVSDYPATAQGMMQTLGNESLAAMLAGQGVPLEVEVDLTPDSGTVSGYKWSSPKGPDLNVPSGTLVQGDVVIRRERPVSKVIPFFRSTEP